MPASDAYNPVDRPVWMTGPPQAPAPYQDTIPGGPVGTLPSPGQTPPPGLPPGPQYQPPDYGAQAQAEYLKRAALADAQGPEGFGGLPPGLEGLPRPQKPLGMSTGAASALLGGPPGQSNGGGRYPPTGPPQPPPDYGRPGPQADPPSFQPRAFTDADNPPSDSYMRLLQNIQNQDIGPKNWIERLNWGLAGAGAGGDQENPFHKAKREARDAKFKQTLEMMNLQERVEQRRQQKDQMALGIAKDLLPLGGTAAELGGTMLADYLKKAGYPTPPGFIEGLKTGAIDDKDVAAILLQKAEGIPVEIVQAAHKNIDPKLVAGLYNTPMNDAIRKATGQKSTLEEKKEALTIEKEQLDMIEKRLKIEHPEIAGDGAMAKRIIRKHMLQNDGKQFTEGTKESQLAAIRDAEADANLEAIKKAQETRAATAGEQIVHGPFYDKKDKMFRPFLKASEVYGEYLPNGKARFNPVRPVDKDTVDLITTGAFPAIDTLKILLPRVLASVGNNQQLGDNLIKAIKNKAGTFAGANQDVKVFLQALTTLTVEEARIFGASSAIRIGLVKILQDHVTPGLYDSKQQVTRMLDQIAADAYNRVKGYQGYGDDPKELVRPGLSAYGPGKYLMKHTDPFTGKKSLKDVTVPARQWSSPDDEVVKAY